MGRYKIKRNHNKMSIFKPKKSYKEFFGFNEVEKPKEAANNTPIPYPQETLIELEKFLKAGKLETVLKAGKIGNIQLSPKVAKEMLEILHANMPPIGASYQEGLNTQKMILDELSAMANIKAAKAEIEADKFQLHGYTTY